MNHVTVFWYAAAIVRGWLGLRSENTLLKSQGKITSTVMRNQRRLLVGNGAKRWSGLVSVATFAHFPPFCECTQA